MPRGVTRTRRRGVGRRSAAEWRLAWHAWRRVASIRLALWRSPYAAVRAQALRRAAHPAGLGGARAQGLERDPEALAWAVGAAARRFPKASCLTQAIALEALLAEAGHPSAVRIGVARRTDGSFEAHAWVELDGRVLIGGLPDLERYAVLPAGAEPPERIRADP